MSSSGVPEPTFTGAGTGDSCLNLFINTTLASPDPDVVESLKKGDFLEVVAVGAEGPIQALTDAGEIAGNIVSTRQLMLLGCLRDGTRYRAKITEHNDGEVNVLITPW